MFYNLVHLRTQNQNRYLGFPELVLYCCGILHFAAGCVSAAIVFRGSLGGQFSAGGNG